MITLTINGEDTELDVDETTPLLWVLRDHLNMTGTKYSCGVGACGACTVLMNGHPIQSCVLTAAEAVGYRVETIEGLSKDGLHPLQQKWIDLDIPQCGYCQSGMIMAAVALLNEKANPSDTEIYNAMENLCRCGTYPRVKEAIKMVAQERGEV